MTRLFNSNASVYWRCIEKEWKKIYKNIIQIGFSKRQKKVNSSCFFSSKKKLLSFKYIK